MQNLEKLMRAVEAQLGQVPEWSKLISAARAELNELHRLRWTGAFERIKKEATKDEKSRL